MELRISVAQVGMAARQEDLRSLMQWLRSDDRFEARITLARAPIRPGEMGGLPESVLLSLAGGAAAAAPVLARAVLEWVKLRKSTMTVRVKTSTGSFEMTVENLSDPPEMARAAEQLVDRLQAASQPELEGGDPDAAA